MLINLKELFDITPDENLNDKVINELLAALKSNQQSEFDYLKFKQSYKNLMALGMDDITAAKSAMLTAATMGLTKEKLLLTVRHYEAVLNKERDKFVQALKKQITNNIESKSEEINSFQERIESNNRKIQQLMKEQELLDQKIEGHKALLASSKQKIEDIKNQFTGTFDVLYKQIEDDHTLFNNIL